MMINKVETEVVQTLLARTKSKTLIGLATWLGGHCIDMTHSQDDVPELFEKISLECGEEIR